MFNRLHKLDILPTIADIFGLQRPTTLAMTNQNDIAVFYHTTPYRVRSERTI